MKCVLILVCLLTSAFAYADPSNFTISIKEVQPDQSTVVKSTKKLAIDRVLFSKSEDGGQASVKIQTKHQVSCTIVTSETAALQLYQLILAGEATIKCYTNGPFDDSHPFVETSFYEITPRSYDSSALKESLYN